MKYLFVVFFAAFTLTTASACEGRNCEEKDLQLFVEALSFDSSENILDGISRITDYFAMTNDPRYYFHRVYELTTNAVYEANQDNYFKDKAWVEDLLIKYSKLYQKSLLQPSEAWGSIHSWLEENESENPQLLMWVSLVGHLRFDMPQALEQVSGSVKELREHKADYQRINAVLFSTTEQAFEVLEERFDGDHAIRFKKIKAFVMQQWTKGNRRGAFRDAIRLERLKDRNLRKLNKKVMRRSRRIQKLDFLF